eukprot:UN28740
MGDAHSSEYIAEHDKRVEFLSGFSGSAAEILVTEKDALLWTDGRYFTQAEKELSDEWTLMKKGLPDVPNMHKYIKEKGLTSDKNINIGIDPNLVSCGFVESYKKTMGDIKSDLHYCKTNLVDELWGKDQPGIPDNLIFELDVKYAGANRAEKLKSLRDELKKSKCSSCVVAALDEIAWFLNVRGCDIEYNPVFLLM